jgi:Tol biopolymer transport system component
MYLVEGDVAARTARVVHSGVECPSLSPDETRIAYKHREGDKWRLQVLDLASGRETVLAETRSVDDQVEWLDDGRILYGLLGDIWVVRADGKGRPRIYIPDALSPAVVRA